MKRRLLPLLLAAAAAAHALPDAIVQPLPLGPVSAYPGALALSGDGRVAAHVGANGVVQLWEATTALLRPEAPAQRPPASSVALNADGSLLVTGHADGRLLLWTRSGTAPLREFRGHAGRILSLQISPDGTRLASGSADGSSQVFDLATGRRLLVLDSVYVGHPEEGVAAPVAVGFAAGGRVLLTQDWQRRQYDVGRLATLWDTAQGLELATQALAPPNGDEALQAGAALGGGGWLLAGTGMKQLMLQRLDRCAPPQALGRPGAEGAEAGSFADALATDPRGRWVATASGPELRFFPVAGGRPTAPLPVPGRVLSLTPQVDGRSLLAVIDTRAPTAGPGMTVLDADAPAPTPARLFRVAVPAAMTALPPLQVAADAQPCLPAETALRSQQFSLPEVPAALAVAARLTPAVPASAGEPALPLGPLVQLRFDSTGRLLALYTARGDTRAAVAAWTLADGQAQPGRALPLDSGSAPPLWLGMDWAVGDGRGGWVRALTGQRLLAARDGFTGPLVTADAQLGRLYRASGSTVEAVTAEGRRLPALTTPGRLQAIAAAGGHLLAVDTEGRPTLFKGSPMVPDATVKPGPSPVPPSDDQVLTRLMLTPDGRYAQGTLDPASSETPGYDIAWAVGGRAVDTGWAVADLPASAHRVVTADRRAHRLAVWDFDRNALVARPPRQRSRDAAGVPVLLKASLSDDGQRLASGSPDGLVRVWDLASQRLLGEARVGAEVTALAFDPAGRQLAVGRGGGQAWVLALP